MHLLLNILAFNVWLLKEKKENRRRWGCWTYLNAPEVTLARGGETCNSGGR